jgi:hypothetical protein
VCHKPRGITPAQADALLRQEQIMAIQREYVNANEFAFSHLKEQLPLVVPQIVLSCGQIMGDSSPEIVNKADEHDYMSVIEQLVMASSTHSVFQADDAKDSLRASAGLFMMEDWRPPSWPAPYARSDIRSKPYYQYYGTVLSFYIPGLLLHDGSTAVRVRQHSRYYSMRQAHHGYKV